jgi:F-type H+-transporting ATPase subunit b
MDHIFSVDPGSVFWTIISFVLLLGILTKVAWKPILSALEAREEGIRKDISQAAEDREAAARARSEYEQSLAEARQQAQNLLAESREKARKYEAEQVELAKAEAQKEKEKAAREIELQSQQAMQGLRGELVDLSLAAAEQLIRTSLKREDHEAIIQESLKQAGGAA